MSFVTRVSAGHIATGAQLTVGVGCLGALIESVSAAGGLHIEPATGRSLSHYLIWN
jgi:hypothetical protein